MSLFRLGSPPYDLVRIRGNKFESRCHHCPYVSPVQLMAPAVAAWHYHECAPAPSG